MSILTILWSLAAGVSLTLCFVHLFVWVRQREFKTNLLFSVSSFGVFCSAILELATMKTTNIQLLNTFLLLENLAIFILLISLIWFIYFYFGTTRVWLAILISGLWIVAIIINFSVEGNLTFAKINTINELTLPWGETFSIIIGETNSLKFIPDFTTILLLVYIVDSSFNVYRKGDHKKAIRVGGSIVLFFIIAGIHTPLVDAGIIQTPYMISLSFVAVIIAMGYQLSDDVINASNLSKEVIANERRWRSLLENVKFLICGVDKEGIINYTNPFYLQTIGYKTEEIIGKHHNTLISPKDKNKIEQLRNTLSSENQIPDSMISIITKKGHERKVFWSNVILNDRDGNYTGTISIGNDLTEKIKAEEDLKRAYEEVESLKNRLEDEVIYLQEEIVSGRFEEIIGDSPAINYVLNRVEEVAELDTTVLLEGETGVGKERIAHAIHDKSLRKNNPFIVVNCAAIPANFLESELFGYEKGAFTGAAKLKHGRFELADNGSIFLDEIGDLPLEIQPKLLRIIETGKFERLGGEKTIQVNVRIIAATNKVLKDEVYSGNFREDLYYRLHIFPISIPPLRQRKSDIPLLVTTFAESFARKHGKKIDQISQGTLIKLQGYDWPGNIRELMNVIERAVITSRGNKLKLIDEFKSTLKTKDENLLTLDEVEKEHILKVLESCNWKISGEDGAAHILNLHPNTLRSRMEKLNIKKSFV